MPAILSTGLALKALASTAASSIAIPAPCAANGSIACAASPSSAIAPSVHSPRSGRVNSAHRRHPSPAPSRTLARAAWLGEGEQPPPPPSAAAADHHRPRRGPALRGERTLQLIGIA